MAATAPTASTDHELTAEAAVTVRVSQAAEGDLADGVRRQLERADGVTVDDLAIAGLQPGLNDTTVEATATLRVADGPDAAAAEATTAAVDADPADVTAAVADRLSDAFGVDADRVDLVDPP